MKRTWIVYVGAGVGNELTDSIANAEWHGPYTREQALRLEAELNEILGHGGKNGEGETAHAMPLENLTPKSLLAHYKEFAAGLEE